MSNSLQDLFDLVPPEQLRRSIQEVFFTWLIEEPVLPENYRQVARDFYLLQEMIYKEERRIKENKSEL
jgi:hypothetical protein